MASALDTLLSIIGMTPSAPAAPPLRDQYPQIYGGQLRRRYPGIYAAAAAAAPTPTAVPPDAYRDPRLPASALSPDLEPQRGLALSQGLAQPTRDDSLIGGLHDLGAPGRSLSEAPVDQNPNTSPDISPRSPGYAVGGTGTTLPPQVQQALDALAQEVSAAGAASPSAPPARQGASPLDQVPAGPMPTPETTGGTQQPSSSFDDALRMAARILGPAPESSVKEPSVWEALMRAGLGMAAAGSRPGASLGGSLAEGALFGLSSYDQARREAEKQRREDRRDQLQRMQTAAQIAGAKVQADQSAKRLNLEEQRLVDTARRDAQRMRFDYVRLRAELADHAENRASQKELAELQRETQKIIAAANGADRRAIAQLNAQRERDEATLRAAERAVESARNARARSMQPALTPEEEQQIMDRVFANSPGSSQYIQWAQSQIIARKAAAEADAKRDLANDPKRLREALKRIDETAARRLREVYRTRPRLDRDED